MTEAQKTTRAETFRTAAALFDDRTLYGFPERPGTIRPTVRGTRVG